MNFLKDLLDLLDSPTEQVSVAEDYLDTLLSRSFADLQSEPIELSLKFNTLNQELANLCFRSYDALILSHSSYLSVSSSFSSLDTGLDTFLATSQELATTCRSFEGFLNADLNPTRSKLSDALLHVDNVGEVLDLPRLVRACVVNGNWPEALDLSKRVNQLLELCKGEASIKVMHRVRFQIASELIDLKLRILESLREKSLRLPAAVRGINLLRRLEEPSYKFGRAEGSTPLTNQQLQLIFLASRWDCLKAQLESLPAAFNAAHSNQIEASEERARFIKRWVEVWRETVGDAVNMYTESFLSGLPTSEKDVLSKSREYLLAFLQHALEELLAMLNANIPLVQSVSSISTLLTQLAYCSAAFARFGCDFRIAIGTIMQDRVLNIVIGRWRQALSGFLAELSPPLINNFTLRSPLHARAQQPIKHLERILLAPDALSKIALIAANYQPATESSITSSPVTNQPAQQLTLYPCLARFLNGITTGLNELRLLPACNLWLILKETLDEVLLKATEGLLALVEGSTPRVSASLSPEQDDEEPLDREKRLKDEADVKMVLRVAAGLMGRSLVPFCEQGLRLGVFGELNEGVLESEIAKTCMGRCEAVLTSLADEA